MIFNDWYTSFLCFVGILDYDRLASSSQKQKCLVILTTILLFSIIPCFVYHSLLTNAKPEAVKSQTKNYHSNKSKWISTKRPKTERHQFGDWIGLGGCLLWNPDKTWWDRQLQTCRQHNSNSNKTSCYHKAHYSISKEQLLMCSNQSTFQVIFSHWWPCF